MAEVPDLQENPQYRATMDRLEKIKHVSPTGVDYWLARDLLEPLGYVRWENFLEAVRRAMSTFEGTGSTPANHFRETTKMVKLGSGGERKVPDYFLSRTACYLITMNGDPTKPEIAAAQAYFAVQARRMELRDKADANLAYDRRRLELRGRVTESAKRVSKVAQDAGVRNKSQGIFHDARYRGLYGLPLKQVKAKKGLSDADNLMDRAGPMELSANDFQMNLAADVIAREGVKGEVAAIQRNQDVGGRVRKVIEDSHGTLPEDLPVEPPIKEIAARLRKALPKP